jgi:hypothetical protein
VTAAAPVRPPSARPSAKSTWGRRCFPGDRRVWVAAGLVLLALLAVAVVELLRPRDVYTGTNSVRSRVPVIEVPRGKTLCLPDLLIPAGTGRIELLYTGPAPRPRLAASLSIGSSTQRTSVPGAPTVGKLTFPFTRRPDSPAAVQGRFCVTPHGGKAVFGGDPGLQSDQTPVRLAGKPLATRVAVWYRPPAGEQATLLSLLPDIAQRAALFRPGWVGTWTYWLLLCLVNPALGYAAVRLLARAAAGEHGRLPSAVAVALLTLANAAVFATLSPSFQAPDESEHAAYVQILGESGHRPAVVPGRGAYSNDEVYAIEAVRAFSSNESSDGRPPWLRADEARYDARMNALAPVPRGNGGGPTTPGTHRPGYYLAVTPAYLAARGEGFFTSLWAMRLVSALFGAIAAAFTVLFVRELFPRAPLVIPVAAGLLAAFLPQFTFISGAVNNDNGINALGAVALFLGARVMRRGLVPGWAAALGATAMLVPLFKATGNALYPALALVVVVALVRHRSRWLPGLAGLAAGAIGGRLVVSALDRIVTPAPSPGAPGGTGGLVGAGGVVQRVLDDPQLFLSYLWQTFLPPLPFMTDFHQTATPPAYEAYIKEGFASFGWYAMTFADWVYQVIFAVVAIVVTGAAVALWQRRRALRGRWPEVALVVLAIMGVLGGVAAAYMAAPPYNAPLPEQGRYAFTALAAFAAVPAAALLAVRRRWLPYVAGALVTGMIALEWASQMMLLQRFYT